LVSFASSVLPSKISPTLAPSVTSAVKVPPALGIAAAAKS